MIMHAIRQSFMSVISTSLRSSLLEGTDVRVTSVSAKVDAALLADLSVLAFGAGGDVLPNDLAKVAKTELSRAIADDGTVCCA